MAFETKSEGRELMVQFTCRRCKCKTIMPYDLVMIGEHYGFLHNSRLPAGWSTIGYSSIVCKVCKEAYEEFMKPVTVEREDD